MADADGTFYQDFLDSLTYTPVYDPPEDPVFLAGYAGGAPNIVLVQPIVTLISSSPVARYEPFIVEITETPAFAALTVQFEALGLPPEVAFIGTTFFSSGFTSQYSPGSAVVAIDEGYRFTLHRADGWISDPTFGVYAAGAGSPLAV